MEVCNDSVNDNIINGESAIVQNVSEIPMVIFLQTPQETHPTDSHELLMPVENDQQNNENINSSDVTPVTLIHDGLGNVTTLDANQQGNIPVTWLGCTGNNSQEQLLYVTYVGDAASGGAVQPMLLQVAPSGDNEEYYNPDKLGEEDDDEEEEDHGQTNNVKPSKKEHTNTWQTIADDVNIETKLQVLDAMLPPIPKSTPSRRNDELISEALYKCDLCRAAFTKAQQYYGHLHYHTGERFWKCDACSMVFATHSLLRRHEKIHVNLRPYVCNLCGLRFDRESQLQYHERRIHLEERSYQCQICLKSFFKRSDLKSHLNIHLGIRKNICETCGRQFNHRSNLKRHSRIHTGIKPYVCNLCGLRFVQVNALNGHKMQQHPTLGPGGYPSYECGHCGKVLRSLPLLKRHIKILHGLEVKQDNSGHLKTRQYYCQICGVSFPFAALLHQHEIDSHAHQDNFLCRNCDQSFSKAADLKSHSCGANHVAKDTEDLIKCDPKNRLEPSDTALQLETLIDETLLDCLNTPNNDTIPSTGDESNKKDNESEMVIYIRTEGQEEPTAVTIKYETNYNHQVAPQIEINENSQLPEINFPIPTDNVNDDNSRFSLLSVASSTSKSLTDNLVVSKEEMDAIDAQKAEELVDSILEREPIKLDSDPPELPPVVVKEKKLFECKDCKKVFNKKSNYTQHLGLHNVDQRKYKCSHCGTTYAWKSSLNKHLQSAHGVNVDQSKIQCTQCSRHFLNGTQYHEHLKRDHLKERNFSCPDCGKKFYKKADLQVHIRIHTKEKPYMCGTCGKAFSHISHIIRHERIHNGIRPYTCEICGKEFTQSTTLKNHRKRHLEPKTPKIKVNKTPRTSKARAQSKIIAQQPVSMLALETSPPSTVDLQIWNAN